MMKVRTEAILSLIAIAMAFISGALVLSVKAGPPSSISAPALEQELNRFIQGSTPIATFNADEIADFINPANHMPSYSQYDYAEILALQKFIANCVLPKTKQTAGLKKAWQWQQFKCGSFKLPDTFFTTPPFFHPSGQSYAALYKTDPAWAREHLKLFHVLELKSHEQLPVPLNLLSKLSWESLGELASNSQIILHDSFVLIASPSENSSYKIYPIDSWNLFWKDTAFQAHKFTNQKNCFLRQNNLCWSFDLKRAYFPQWNPLVLLLVLSVLSTIILFSLLAVKIRKRSRDEHRLQFALEMLAHEIRTPLTNLAFTTENFRSHFDLFPAASQSDLLRLFDQVERLKRVVETSSRYLSKDIKAPVLEAKFTELKSLTSFIEHTLDPYLTQIELRFHNDNNSILTDPYWASVCIKNLIENALQHGVKPVRVLIERHASEWRVEVQDAGTKTFIPAQKSEQSHGLGLGLKLVQEIMPLLNGKLEITYNPTRMKLTFKEIK